MLFIGLASPEFSRFIMEPEREFIKSRGSVVGIATVYRLDDRGAEFETP
jgi:hypothetical protein